MLIWLVVALLAAIGEVLTTGLFLASASAAALVTAVLSLFLGPSVQVVAFGALTLLGVLVVRPFLVHAMGLDSLMHSAGSLPSPHIVGRRAIVTQQVDVSSGQIRIGQGEFWTARPYDSEQLFAPGTKVEIMLVDGLTALVAPVEPQRSLESEESPAREKEEVS
jgi:membrane protein implicated in regulation of membrane protease activity